ncbi:MAG: YdcF family protein [Micropepsaceae bacterium]
MHPWFGFAFRILVAAFVLAALGFPVFVWSIARTSSEPDSADAIVALTGGEGRLTAGLQLLDRDKGARLLISGVHIDTTREQLFAAVGQLPLRAACCVDLGRSAENTIGNAHETARWVHRRGYNSLIVVTASYHMPRSLMELHAVLPETKLIAYPVFPDRVRLDEWWRDGETSAVLAWEYLKFLGSIVRVAGATALWTAPASLPDNIVIEDAPGEAPPEPVPQGPDDNEPAVSP